MSEEVANDELPEVVEPQEAVENEAPVESAEPVAEQESDPWSSFRSLPEFEGAEALLVTLRSFAHGRCSTVPPHATQGDLVGETTQRLLRPQRVHRSYGRRSSRALCQCRVL